MPKTDMYTNNTNMKSKLIPAENGHWFPLYIATPDTNSQSVPYYIDFIFIFFSPLYRNTRHNFSKISALSYLLIFTTESLC
jgi:hypothetical protein